MLATRINDAKYVKILPKTFNKKVRPCFELLGCAADGTHFYYEYSYLLYFNYKRATIFKFYYNILHFLRNNYNRYNNDNNNNNYYGNIYNKNSRLAK